MTTRGGPVDELAQVVRAARSVLAEIDFPLPTADAAAAAGRAAAVAEQIDDYALPRLTALTAPLLVVVGGSTGAGKSTLVNSLVRAPVSPAGVLRPTTRAPVLICASADAGWFRGHPLTGPLIRGTDPDRLQLIVAPALPSGLAFLDAPDIDSVVAGNREVAHRLLAAADLWLFLTTANRYADAVPWRLLQTAGQRGAVVALVLGRVAAAVSAEVFAALSELLAARSLSQLPVFVVPESRIDRQGQLPESATSALRGWLDSLAADPAARASVVRCTLDGVLAAVPTELTGLAAALDEQAGVAERLAEQVGLAFGVARGTVERGMRTAPDRAGAATGSGPGADALARLVCSAVADAVEQIDIAWRADPAGAGLLAGTPARVSERLAEEVGRLFREQPADGLPHRIEQLLYAEAARWLEPLAGGPRAGDLARRLRELAPEWERARVGARLLTSGAAVPEPAGGGPARAADAAPGTAAPGTAGGTAGPGTAAPEAGQPATEAATDARDRATGGAGTELGSMAEAGR